MTKDIRKAIKKGLKSKGLTQKAAAEKLGIRQEHLSRFLLGKTGIGWASLVRLLAIADIGFVVIED